MKSIIAIGVDLAFANMGLSRVEIITTGDGYSTLTPCIRCLNLKLVSTSSEDKKVVRKSSDNLRRAIELHDALHAYCDGASFAFVEVPHGSQSAVSAAALGISIGVMASCPIPIIEVNAAEVKAAVGGSRKGVQLTKAEMIAWAAEQWPEANWIRAQHKATVKGRTLPAGRLTNDNEHTADAMAAVKAGISTPAFKQLLTLLDTHEIARPYHHRSALGERRRVLLQV